MRLLMYQNNHRAQKACCEAMIACGAVVEGFSCPLQTKEQQKNFLPLILQLIKEHRAQAVFSFEYFEGLSEACEQAGCRYISFCCDILTMSPYAANLANSCNVILTADSGMVELYQKNGAQNVFYLPLAVLLQGNSEKLKTNVTMVSGLHENNLYKHFAGLPDMMRGLLDGICEAHVHVYGNRLYRQAITDKIWKNLMQGITIASAKEQPDKYQYVVENFFMAEQTTYLERLRAAEMLSKRFTEFLLISPEIGAKKEGIRYGTEGISYAARADIYTQSAVNIHMANRARYSGVPQQMWDILGCGGFLIASYQEDANGLLQPGEDYVVYESLEHLAELTEYYLAHPKEREEIAENAKRKVLSEHTWQKRAQAILSLLEA